MPRACKGAGHFYFAERSAEKTISVFSKRHAFDINGGAVMI
jgi:hypothetical protein